MSKKWVGPQLKRLPSVKRFIFWMSEIIVVWLNKPWEIRRVIQWISRTEKIDIFLLPHYIMIYIWPYTQYLQNKLRGYTETQRPWCSQVTGLSESVSCILETRLHKELKGDWHGAWWNPTDSAELVQETKLPPLFSVHAVIVLDS